VSSAASSIDVVPIAAQDTWPLRKRVLRPHQEGDAVVLGGDDDQRAAHLGARDADGTIVGIATISPQDCPWAPDRPGAWRLRGMATADELRGRGVGALVLGAAVRHARGHGAGLVWCNARVGALAFYTRAGFVAAGERYVDPLLGPHVPMQLDLEGDRSG
jgi:GNAT superfamily N-acetyltransferase